MAVLTACLFVPGQIFAESPVAKITGGIITGSLMAPDGSALDNPLIFLFDADGPSNQPLTLAVPNQSNVYTFKGLDTGDYKIAFSGRQGLRSYYEYFDGYSANAFDDANRIGVVDGQTTSGIDAVLGQSPGGTVEGRITDPYDRGFRAGTITAYQQQAGTWVATEFSTEIKDYRGNYTLDLPAGTYRLRVDAGADTAPGQQQLTEYWPDAITAAGGQDVTLSLDQLITGLDVSLGENATGSISGTVTDASNQPVAGVEVRAYDFRQGALYDTLTVTASDGSFTLSGLWPEQYYVDAYDPLGRFEPTFFGGTTAGGVPVVRIPVTDGAMINGADISVAADDPATPNGSISGIVTEASGALAANISVQARDPQCDSSESSCSPLQATTRTSSGGFYRLRSLPANAYVVRFSDPSGKGLTEYYDDQPTAAAADLVTVVGPAVSGIDAQLGLAGIVEGTVVRSDGDPFYLLTVTAYRQVAGQWQAEASINDLQGDGAWRIDGLPADDYVLLFAGQNSLISNPQVEFYDDRFSFETADTVAVIAGQTTTALDAVIGNAAPGGISGSISDDLGAPLVTGLARIWDERLIQIVGSQQVGANGSFSFVGLRPGTYYVEFLDIDGVLPSEWWNDVADSSWAAPIEVSTTVLTGFDAELGTSLGGPGGGGISGQVVDDATGLPIADAIVVCYADDFTPVPSCRDVTALDGSFTVGGNLPAGDYVLYAAPESGYVPEYYQNALDFEDATTIAVSLGNIANGFELRLDVPAVIEGSVAVTSGIDSVAVDALLQDGSDWRFLRRVMADSNGDYRVDGLPSGNARVRFIGWSGGQPTLVEYYDDEAALDDATTVSLASGQTVTGIDATLGNLVPLINPSFEGSLDGWSSFGSEAQLGDKGGITYDVADRLNSQASQPGQSSEASLSGSVRFQHQGSIGETLTLSQCVAIDVDGDYSMSAFVDIRGSAPQDPSVRLLAESFKQADCSGAPLSSSFAAAHSGATARWTAIEGDVELPAGTRSVLVSVVVDGGSTTNVDVLVDDVSLTLGGLLFGDDFETGLLTGWSGVIGESL